MVAVISTGTNVTFFAADPVNNIRFSTGGALSTSNMLWDSQATIGYDDNQSLGFGDIMPILNGTIGEVAVWNRNLPVSDLSVMYVAARYAYSPPAPEVLVQPIPQAVYAGKNPSFTIVVTPIPPISYQWQKVDGESTIDLTDTTGNIGGSTGPTLYFTNCISANGGTYQCRVTGPGGVTTTIQTTLTIVTPTERTYEFAISNAAPIAPIAYWRLNEATSSTYAYDYFGAYVGTYGADSQTNVGLSGSGPTTAGFEPGNTGLTVVTNDATGFVTVPAIPIPVTNTNVTITAWINPAGPQYADTGAGIFFNRLTGNASGLVLYRHIPCRLYQPRLPVEWQRRLHLGFRTSPAVRSMVIRRSRGDHQRRHHLLL